MMRTQPIAWADMTGLASYTTPSPVQSPRLTYALKIDVKNVPPSMNELLQRIGRGCTTIMAAAHFKQRPPVPASENSFLFPTSSEWVWLVECSPAERSKYDTLIHSLEPEKYSWDENDNVTAFEKAQPASSTSPGKQNTP